MLVLDSATNIYNNELGSPTNTSIPAIVTYLRSNVGDLNNLLGECFSLNNIQGTTNYLEIIQGNNNQCLISDEAMEIYKYIYLMTYYQRMVFSFTGVGDTNILVQASSDEGTLRFVDKGNLAKIYIGLRKDTENTLKTLVNKYKMRRQTAQQVIGDDVIIKYKANYPNGEPGILYQNDLY